MVKVDSIHIYPIKGMQGKSVQSAKVMERGLEHDRRYMLIDEQSHFISQRNFPQLVFFHPEIINETLVVNHEGATINIPLSASLGNTIHTTIFEHTVLATEVSQEANNWFSSILGQNVRLVKMGDNDVRYKKLIKGPDKVEVSFADGYPYLIAGTESINKLNSKLDSPVLLNRFRPNIVVSTSDAHIEDTWDKVQIGEVGFRMIKPCARCSVVTVDQSNGILSKKILKTLSSYRKIDNKVYFGTNAICRSSGFVHIGDEVIVL